GDLEQAEIKHPTIRGSIEIKFQNRGDIFSMDVKLPANTQSDIGLPKKYREYSLFKDGENVKVKEQEDHVLIEDVSPGEHSFEIRKGE
ncbi:MAG: hypothetical protein KGY70_19240, partial [Bacteroidales bacterium]|nr:hypothetical protein [Bacteroidales bacterium]